MVAHLAAKPSLYTSSLICIALQVRLFIFVLLLFEMSTQK